MAEPTPTQSHDRTAVGSGGDDNVIPSTLAPLPDLVSGTVRFDAYTRELYATDASIYRATPIAVVFPTDTTDVSAVLEYCWEHEVPVLPRGAGTSLAGQAVNEAVVLDLSRELTGILQIDEDARTCRAQSGIVLARLNEGLASTELKFAPDPAWGDKSTLGGAIANNSTGAHSLKYGTTAAYVESCEVVLSDGTISEFGWIDRETLSERADPTGDLEERIYAFVKKLLTEDLETIDAAFPTLHRNVAGYNLQHLLTARTSDRINIARLVAGSEGTLGVVTAATVSLEPRPSAAGTALLTYPSRTGAIADVAPILEHQPAAVEIIDDVLLELAAETEAFGPIIDRLPDNTAAVLLVECYGDSTEQARESLQSLVGARVDRNPRIIETFEAYDRNERAKFWTLRKSGLPILLSRTTDEKHIAFIEDTAVPAEQLPNYVEEVQEVLAAHDTFASFYGHAGPGCLHIRPLVNTKTDDGLERMESIAERVAEIAVSHGGTISGEHGDGRARTPWLREMYGEDVLAVFRSLKQAFDPKGIFNPGQIVGDGSMTDNLRIDPDYRFDANFEPTLSWDVDNGLQGMVELCHGCGGCRGNQSTTGGVMCPTYRASEEEITSTRGRANLLRAGLSGALSPDEIFSDRFLTEVLDLCIGCKGCARDCPSEVDMAKLKAELTHEYHQRSGASWRDRLFANIDRVATLGSATAPVSNWITELPGTGVLAEYMLGLSRERTLPTFHRESFQSWFAERAENDAPADADRQVLLFPDTYTNYVEPGIGRAAVRVLEASGVDVSVPQEVGPTGRAAYSMGFLDTARERAQRIVSEFHSQVSAEQPLLILEPSDAVMIQSDYAALLEESPHQELSRHTYGVLEWLDHTGIPIPHATTDRHVTYHSHCHQHATKRAQHAATVLRTAGVTVDTLDSGCCGMAGSFGYEAEHYAMSKAIGRLLYNQVDASPGDFVVAPGASCRTQLADHLDERAKHPIEVLDSVTEI